jgi:hypothetical protein
MAAPRKIDWTIARDRVEAGETIRSVAADMSISAGQISKRAKAEQWQRPTATPRQKAVIALKDVAIRSDALDRALRPWNTFARATPPTLPAEKHDSTPRRGEGCARSRQSSTSWLNGPEVRSRGRC